MGDRRSSERGSHGDQRHKEGKNARVHHGWDVKKMGGMSRDDDEVADWQKTVQDEDLGPSYLYFFFWKRERLGSEIATDT